MKVASSARDTVEDRSGRESEMARPIGEEISKLILPPST
jgi:hypothetical protein